MVKILLAGLIIVINTWVKLKMYACKISVIIVAETTIVILFIQYFE